MKKIKKKIFNIKIQKIIQKYNFVLFFQYNNLKNKQYIFLKNIFYNKQKNYTNSNMLVCNNKYFYKYIKKNKKTNTNTLEKIKKNEFLYEFLNLNLKIKKSAKKKINNLCIADFYNIFCIGPTLLFFFNEFNECENILYFFFPFIKPLNCKNTNLSVFEKEKYKIYNTYLKKKENTLNYSLKKNKNSNINIKINSEIQKIPHIFIEKKKQIFEFKNNQKIKMPYLFFVGGIYKNTFINYLDLKKLYKLNNNVYNTLINVYYENIKNFLYVCNNIKFNLYFLIFILYKFLNILYFINKQIKREIK